MFSFQVPFRFLLSSFFFSTLSFKVPFRVPFAGRKISDDQHSASATAAALSDCCFGVGAVSACIVAVFTVAASEHEIVPAKDDHRAAVTLRGTALFSFLMGENLV